MQRSTLFSLALCFALASPAAFSGEDKDKDKLGCIGQYKFRQKGTEVDTTHYRFRNFNANRTLTVTSITIYAFDGTVVASFSGNTFPADFNPVLGPNQTAALNLEDVFGNTQAPGDDGHLQTIVTWQADGGGNPLHLSAGRITRQRDAAGNQGETRARAILRCEALK
jgi:hypothetical protein